MPRILTIPTRDKSYEKAKNAMVDELFGLSDDLGWSWGKLAHEAGLAYSTVWRLGYYITSRPQDRTIEFLTQAVGMRRMLVRVTGKARRAS